MKKESQNIDDFPILATYSPVKVMFPLPMEALGNARYGSWRPLINLTQTFQVCNLSTPPFFGGHPYIWCTTVRHIVPYPSIWEGEKL